MSLKGEQLTEKLELAMRAPTMIIAAALCSPAAMAQNHQGGIYFPEQIHLSLTGVPGEMAIDWVSSAPPGTAMVQYSEQPWLGEPLYDECKALKETGPPQCEPPNVKQPAGACHPLHTGTQATRHRAHHERR